MMAVPAMPCAARLSDLLAGMVPMGTGEDRSVTGLCADSRMVAPGDLFLARSGARADGRAFIDAAIRAGAVAVAYESAEPVLGERAGVPLAGVPELVARIGIIAERFFGHPSRDLWVAGVTGTNGKTTVSHLVAAVLHQWPLAGAKPHPCGLLGTLGYGVYGALRRGLHTTPDAVELHRALANLRDRGAGQVVMEVSSHGLAQGRVAGVSFDTAVFTNLTRDHLDYHADMAAYAAAKRSLFQVPGLRHAVVNLDDPVGRMIFDDLPAGVAGLGYSLRPAHPEAALVATHLEAGPSGLHLRVRTPQGTGSLSSPLLGRFNAANLLAALGTLLSLDLPLDPLLARLGRARTAPGRMERFGADPGRPVAVVDYAHTPDAMTQVLHTLRAHCRRRLWCVFGCGGDRDRGKRPLMGAAAERHADRVVLTDDNPRSEDGDAIIGEILAGMQAPDRALVQRDRAAAIALAMSSAGPGDIVLIAGKGHEDYQERAGERRPYSDRAVVSALLGGRDGGGA